MRASIKSFALPLALALSLSLSPAHAQSAPLTLTVEQKLAEGPVGARFGLLVTTLDGEVLVSIAPDQRFIPASNTKMFTTAIAYAELPLLRKLPLASALFFDFGVFALVLGATVLVLIALAHQSLRVYRAGAARANTASGGKS